MCAGADPTTGECDGTPAATLLTCATHSATRSQTMCNAGQSLIASSETQACLDSSSSSSSSSSSVPAAGDVKPCSEAVCCVSTGDVLPGWVVPLLVILGVLLLLCCCFVLFFILMKRRKKKRKGSLVKEGAKGRTAEMTATGQDRGAGVRSNSNMEAPLPAGWFVAHDDAYNKQ